MVALLLVCAAGCVAIAAAYVLSPSYPDFIMAAITVAVYRVSMYLGDMSAQRGKGKTSVSFLNPIAKGACYACMVIAILASTLLIFLPDGPVQLLAIPCAFALWVFRYILSARSQRGGRACS